MTILEKLINNQVLVAGICAWFVAQVIKAVLYALIHRRFSLERLVGDGGMPSGHSATVTAVAVTCALRCGLGSEVFAVSAILAIITCHDAMNARQQIGKQAIVLNQILKDMLEGETPETLLKEFVGHTRAQVLTGCLLGALVATALHSLW